VGKETFFPKDCIYLFDGEREHKRGEWQAGAEGEAGSPQSKEPDVGLNPRTLGS